MSEVRRLVLDVLKPHQPTMLVLADRLGDLEGVHEADITLMESDDKVENIRTTPVGDVMRRRAHRPRLGRRHRLSFASA
jgi:hypothetical protein